MKCGKCGMEYGNIHNFCNNCGNKLRDKVSIKYYNGVRKFKDLSLCRNMPSYYLYSGLVIGILLSILGGRVFGGYFVNSSIMTTVSFFLYAIAFVLLIFLFVLKYVILYKILYHLSGNYSISPVLKVIFLMIPIFGSVYHFFVYYKIGVKYFNRFEIFVFLFYCLLNFLLLIPGFFIFLILPFVTADLFVYRLIIPIVSR